MTVLHWFYKVEDGSLVAVPGGSLQRVAEIFISHWVYKVIFNLSLGEVENHGFPLVFRRFSYDSRSDLGHHLAQLSLKRLTCAPIQYRGGSGFRA